MRHEHHFRGDPGVFGDPRTHFHAEARGGVPFPPFPPGPPGPGGPFGPGFPSGFPGFPGFGQERGRRRGRGPERHGRGRRSRRGDIRTAILALLLERSMHGYEMIQEIKERSADLWRPSPGSVYPTLQLLADEGLINDEGQGSRRLYALTEEGRTAAEAIETPPWEEIARDADPRDVNLRDAIGQLMGATMQVVQAANDEQKKRAAEVLNTARRELYAILGEAPSTDEDESDED
ncbi:PadR family transcriptional regulator [Actinophytocola glycyrrhizae]|uniref:PadR family transcriptional regulator n=1 Tax=Actinophytocola glycyrrhizae TaxID=2044873 RepID=A0ABV9S6G3_9PSEU